MPLTCDAWAAALLCCDGRTAVRSRGVASVLRDAVDLACRMGLAQTGRVPATFVQVDRACRHHIHRVSPWLALVGQTAGPVVRWFAANGHIAHLDILAEVPFCANRDDAVGALREAAVSELFAVLDRLADPPYSLGQDDARAGGSWVLRFAASHGRVAVLERLARPPYSLAQEDARAHGAEALRYAAENGHVAVLDRLALPPFSLGQEDACAGDNWPIRLAASNGHVAVLDRLAQPPYSLGQDDARACGNSALRCAASNGHVDVLDRLAEPPYSLGHEDTGAGLWSMLHEPWSMLRGPTATKVKARLARPPYMCEDKNGW